MSPVPEQEWPPNGELSAWIARQFPEGFQGYAVDVGASDGISVNSTYMLESLRWTVLCIEPNPVFWPKLRKLRPFVMTCACDSEAKDSATLHTFTPNPEAYSALRPTHPPESKPSEWSAIEVPVKTLDQCLEEAQFPRLDVLCVDVEGNELEVLKGVNFAKWKPKAIVVESWTDPSPALQYVEALGYERKGKSVDNWMYVKEGKDAATQGC